MRSHVLLPAACLPACSCRCTHLRSLKTSVIGMNATPSAPGKKSAPKLELVSLLPPSVDPLRLLTTLAALQSASDTCCSFSAAAAAVTAVLCRLIYGAPPPGGAICAFAAEAAAAMETPEQEGGAVPRKEVLRIYPAKLAAKLLMMLLAPPAQCSTRAQTQTHTNKQPAIFWFISLCLIEVKKKVCLL